MSACIICDDWTLLYNQHLTPPTCFIWFLNRSKIYLFTPSESSNCFSHNLSSISKNKCIAFHTTFTEQTITNKIINMKNTRNVHYLKENQWNIVGIRQSTSNILLAYQFRSALFRANSSLITKITSWYRPKLLCLSRIIQFTLPAQSNKNITIKK